MIFGPRTRFNTLLLLLLPPLPFPTVPLYLSRLYSSILSSFISFTQPPLSLSLSFSLLFSSLQKPSLRPDSCQKPGGYLVPRLFPSFDTRTAAERTKGRRGRGRETAESSPTNRRLRISLLPPSRKVPPASLRKVVEQRVRERRRRGARLTTWLVDRTRSCRIERVDLTV